MLLKYLKNKGHLLGHVHVYILCTSKIKGISVLTFLHTIYYPGLRQSSCNILLATIQMNKVQIKAFYYNL